MLAKISLERGGKFHALNMQNNAHKCAAMRTRTYHYYVKVVTTDAKLTPEGYVFNNEYVQTYFDTKWGRQQGTPWDGMSCELMALTAATELCEKIVASGVDVYSVLCRIKGSNGAWIEAICKPDKVGV